ncbi:hypothetical protein C7S20_05790 [Christiangramia fulva]|uniref:Glycosyl hydrolase-like 10 domain-containing protein n=1 Tax=Christiangramia fulva TaxID=2126553 RepID=A0A2R3Z3H5_9FLAO|nr:family 10 glycosylhydrolase [Christiangramia fulva]AVR44816.1 hypothetical protein C7S20_05790 [Christiangramia fulva]
MSIFKKSSALLFLSLFLLTFFACKTPEAVVPTKEASKKEEQENVVKPSEQESQVSLEGKEDIPSAQKEFRAAWVATVANINWPSKPGLPSDVQQKEALKILDAAVKSHLNAIILQVRPQADALYDSELEPWSYYLTGKNGKAPQPYYDPLKFWIDEAHKRGLELHAWLNPYRAHHTTAGEIGSESIIKKHPEWVVELQNGMWWMDPANKEVQDFSAQVVKDIVKRYDIDGIHFDDYFYPYPSYNNNKGFPDEKSWKKYLAEGGELSRADWRRKNVNDFIQRVAKDIKSEKGFVKFGISPFGIWRPDFPVGIKGMDQYDVLYADAKLWLNNGWIDYFTPQLYWPTRQINLSFPVLLGWWDSENVTSRHLWPGINLSLEEKEENKGEIISQIMISRGILHDDPGVVLWSIGQLLKNDELDSSLVAGPYRANALVPPSPWLDDEPPAQPDFRTEKTTEGNFIISRISDDPADVFRWVLYFKYEEEDWNYRIFNKIEQKAALPLKNAENKMLESVGITTVDRTGNESEFKKIPLHESM